MDCTGCQSLLRYNFVTSTSSSAWLYRIGFCVKGVHRVVVWFVFVFAFITITSWLLRS
jgi:hypothetical protein